MARRRFFADDIRDGAAAISGEDALHLARVLRVEPGQRYEIARDGEVWLAEIEHVEKHRVQFRLIEPVAAPQPRASILLFAALTKFDRFEWMIEKATELGVAHIAPVAAQRSEKGLADAARKRADRWKKIARESSQQARRASLPIIADVCTLDAALDCTATHRYFLDEAPGNPLLIDLAPVRRTTQDRIALLVGPEGGWSDQERSKTLASPWTGVWMGEGILRAETACLAALALVRQIWDPARITE